MHIAKKHLNLIEQVTLLLYRPYQSDRNPKIVGFSLNDKNLNIKQKQKSTIRFSGLPLRLTF